MKQTVWVKKVDSTPTQNSENLVESGGVYSELAGKQSALTFDNVPINESTNPVTSGGVYAKIGPMWGIATCRSKPATFRITGAPHEIKYQIINK